MVTKKELCGRCAAILKKDYKLHRVGGGADHKVNCQECKHRRFGGLYELHPRGKGITVEGITEALMERGDNPEQVAEALGLKNREEGKE